MSGAHYCIEDLEVGMEAAHERGVTGSDIETFAELSGDNNPVHLDAEFAAKSPFKARIAHGMLTASFISTILGTKLPGHGCIYLSQTLRFKAPVRIGDTVRALARISSLDRAKRRAELDCSVSVGDKVVLEGEALVLVPSRG
ncbi:MaoC family dehydratase [Nordella sp. HKS 07]|uniref:MaoC family dehydratase n=1 Tax=Nordella sp. HKS 07 TaxID=2712222 RepID=UPI0013E12368|nr:MaoC family dehydratase [Nordella sp. HKS 07]QIG49139.1 MaoC family dehydratase [Nordella sp. HKS 07]